MRNNSNNKGKSARGTKNSSNKENSYSKKDSGSKKESNSSYSSRGTKFRKDDRSEFKSSKPYSKKEGAHSKDFSDKKDSSYSSHKSKFRKDDGSEFKSSKPYPKKEGTHSKDFSNKKDSSYSKGKYNKDFKKKSSPVAKRTSDGKVRLNRFLAHSGVCSRREADVLIGSGVVSINGKVVTELGTRVDPQNDKIMYGGDSLNPQKLRYVLLNKPKGFVTTTDDPQKRNTVMGLVQNACIERIYPIDRLDRNSTGLLLFTNDGDLVDHLTSSKSRVPKSYLVELDKTVKSDHLNSMVNGLEIEGETETVKFESAEIIEEGNKRKTALITILAAKNRVISRMFEHMGYEVKKVDRIKYGELTKKGLLRGKWRHLSDQEVGFLKMLR